MSTHVCWKQACKSMWGAFFANCKSQHADKLAVQTKLTLLDRAVLPVLHHRDTRWPPSKQRCQDIDRMQRKMVAAILRPPMLSGECPADHARRRNRLASAQIAKAGPWRINHYQRVLAWDAHCRRSRNKNSWASMLLDVRGESWLAERRAHCRMGTETRVNRGAPATRWHEGVRFAIEALRHG